MRARRAIAPVLGLLALVATACPEQPGGGGTTTTTTTTTSTTTTTTLADVDGDGYTTGADCDDNNPAINPGVTVDSIGDGVDSNCDGQDGIATNTVFVSVNTGSDTSTCGDISAPCASVNQGQARAVALGRTQVQVAEGFYGPFELLGGLEVGGHYKSSTWAKAGAGNSVVTAAFDPSALAPVGVKANGISVATKLADFVINGTTAGAGQASYGVIIRNSTSALVLDTITVNGGTGGAGGAGSPGAPPSAFPAIAGFPGGNGFEPSGTYNNTDSGQGGLGMGGGGKGGNGGVVDASTSVFGNHDAQPGQGGANGTGGAAGGTGGRDRKSVV